MKLPISALLASAILFSANSMAANQNLSTLNKSLKSWQPNEIIVQGSQITIVTPGASVTPEIFNAIIFGGVCHPMWTKGAGDDFLKGVSQLNVVNKFKAAGYAFEKPAKTCKEMGTLMEKPATAVMLGNTHMYNG